MQSIFNIRSHHGIFHTNNDTATPEKCRCILRVYCDNKQNKPGTISISASGEDKQVILDAIRGLHLSKVAAAEILENLITKMIDPSHHCHDEAADINLVTEVLTNLEHDHRLLPIFQYGATNSYKDAKIYLESLVNESIDKPLVVSGKDYGTFGLFSKINYPLTSEHKSTQNKK